MIKSTIVGLCILLSSVMFLTFSIPCAESVIVVDEAKLNFTGHMQGSVHSVDWSPDGSYIVSGGEDHVAIIWDATTGGTWLSFQEHQDQVLCVDWARDGQKVASGSADGKAFVWNPSDGTLLRSLLGHGDQVTDLEWSPNGTLIATGSGDHTARIWNWFSGQVVAEFDGHNDVVNCVSWSPDNIKVASGGADATIRIWSSSTGDEILTLRGHSDTITSLTWAQNGTWLASASLDGTVRIWDLARGTNVITFYEHDGGVLSVTWLDGGTTIASAGEDSMIRVWDPNTGRVYLNYTAHRDIVRSIALSSDGERLVSGSDDHTCRIWSLNVPPPAPMLIIPTAHIQRSFSTLIMADVPDYPDSVDVLEPEFQYKRHSNSIWYEKFFSEPEYKEGMWKVHFTPDVNATLGPYDFRVRFKDERALSSPWTLEESKLEVVNNEPSAVIWSAPQEIDRGRVGTLVLAVSDIETPPEMMLIRLEFAPETVEDWNGDIFETPAFNRSSGMWDCNFVFPLTGETGDYRFRARCIDGSLGVSDWDYLPTMVRVLNNIPEIDELHVNQQSIHRGERVRIWFTVADMEEGGILPEIEIEVRSERSDGSN